jgi:Uma2 family endonuclease
MAQPAADVRRWTREEYERLVEAGFFSPEERLELVDGMIYEMTPHTTWHATGILNCEEELRAVFSEGFHVRTQLPLALGSHAEPEPDLAVVPGRRHDYRSGHPTLAVLVVEVSETSAQYDREVKRRLYAEADIPEYWLLYPRAGQLEVLREPQKGDYRSRILLGPADTVSPLAAPGSLIRVADLLP